MREERTQVSFSQDIPGTRNQALPPAAFAQPRSMLGHSGGEAALAEGREM